MTPGLYWARAKSKKSFRRPDYTWTGLINLRGEAPFLRPSIMYNFVDNCHVKAEMNLYELLMVKPAHMYTVNDLLPEEVEAGLYLDPNSLLLIKVEGVGKKGAEKIIASAKEMAEKKE